MMNSHFRLKNMKSKEDLKLHRKQQRLQIDKTKIIGAISDLKFSGISELNLETEEGKEIHKKIKKALDEFKNIGIGVVNVS